MTNERDSEIESNIARLLKSEEGPRAAIACAHAYAAQVRKKIEWELRTIPEPQRALLVEEACADVWAQVAASIDQFRGESRFKTWLISIAQHTAWRVAKKWRAAERRQRPMSAGEEDALPAPPDAISSWMRSSKARRLRPALDPWMKAVLSSLERGKSWSGVARSRETTVAACTSRWQRGIRRLRKLFMGSNA